MALFRRPGSMITLRSRKRARGLLKAAGVILLALAGTGMGTGLGVAQSPAPKPQKHKNVSRRDQSAPGVKAVINLAYTVPPEWGADALLRLVRAGLIHSKARRRELLTDAFNIALQAREPVKYGYALGHSMGTREEKLWHGYYLNVDRESLRCRAIQLMSPPDRRRARQWFEQMGLPRPPRDSCRSTLVYDPTLFYQTLGLLVRKGFSEQERAEGEPVEWVERYLTTLSSPAQVVPAANMLASFKLPSRDFERLLDAFSGALARMPPNSRAFQNGAMLISAMRPLAEKCRSAGIACDPLVKSVRRYIRNNMQAVRCADSVKQQARAPHYRRESTRRWMWPAVDKQFNSWSARKPPYVSKEVPALARKDVQPVRIGPAPNNPEYWKSPTASRLLKDLALLRFKKIGPRLQKKPGQYSLAERRGHEWMSRFYDYLGRLEAWKEDDKYDEMDVILQKLSAYSGLAELVPAGEARNRLLASYVALLRDFLNRRPDLRAAGLGSADTILLRLSRSRLTAAGERKQWYQDEDWVLRAFEGSGSPLLVLFARLKRLTERRAHPAGRPAPGCSSCSGGSPR